MMKSASSVLGDAEGCGARGLEVDRQAKMVEGKLAVVAGDGEEAR